MLGLPLSPFYSVIHSRRRPCVPWMVDSWVEISWYSFFSFIIFISYYLFIYIFFIDLMSFSFWFIISKRIYFVIFNNCRLFYVFQQYVNIFSLTLDFALVIQLRFVTFDDFLIYTNVCSFKSTSDIRFRSLCVEQLL